MDAGELGAGHSATALYAVVLNPGAEGRLATVQLRWEDPATGQVTEINNSFNTWELASSFEMASSFETANAHYQLAVTVAQYAELLRGACGQKTRAWARWGHAARLAVALAVDADAVEFAALVSRASGIAD